MRIDDKSIPDFLIIGTQKAGTTWLLDNLRQHPDVFMPPHELHYFSRDDHYSRGLDWYTSFFEAANPHQVLGEKTPDYLDLLNPENPQSSPHTHERIHQLNPRMKLIVVLRDPVSRALSAVTHMYRTGKISPFIALEDLFFGKYKHLCDQLGLITAGKYAIHLTKYLSLFEPDRLKIFIFEKDIKLKSNSATTMAEICRFLGVDEQFAFPDLEKKKNVYRHSKPALILNHYLPKLRPLNNRLNHFFPVYKPEVTESLRLLLWREYEGEIEKLTQLGIDVPGSWMSASV